MGRRLHDVAGETLNWDDALEAVFECHRGLKNIIKS